MSGLFTLYTWRVSWYSAKVRSYLQDRGIAFNEVKPSLWLYNDRPSMGDYGLIGPLYAHIGRDLVDTRPNLKARIARMFAPREFGRRRVPSRRPRERQADAGAALDFRRDAAARARRAQGAALSRPPEESR
jgi:hypothetical protein